MQTIPFKRFQFFVEVKGRRGSISKIALDEADAWWMACWHIRQDLGKRPQRLGAKVLETFPIHPDPVEPFFNDVPPIYEEEYQFADQADT